MQKAIPKGFLCHPAGFHAVTMQQEFQVWRGMYVMDLCHRRAPGADLCPVFDILELLGLVMALAVWFWTLRYLPVNDEGGEKPPNSHLHPEQETRGKRLSLYLVISLEAQSPARAQQACCVSKVYLHLFYITAATPTGWTSPSHSSQFAVGAAGSWAVLESDCTGAEPLGLHPCCSLLLLFHLCPGTSFPVQQCNDKF